MDIPKSLNLWSVEGNHAGFMLISANPDSNSGECVFMLSPISTEGIESLLGVVVSELKLAGQHRFEVSKRDQGFVVTIRPEGFPEVVLNLDENFEGEIHTEFNDENTYLGTVEPVEKNA